MKRIIDGRRYDTETAQEVAKHSNGRGWNDFYGLSETLYRTRLGAWFLHGIGGAFTEWGEPEGTNGRVGSEGIRPLSEGDAKEWLMDRGQTEALEQYFADWIEDA